MNTQGNQVETFIDATLTNRDRTTSLFRYVLVVPVLIFTSFLWVSLSVPTALALVVRQMYPSYALTFTHAILELHNRVLAYLLLLTDDYPSIERNPKVAVLFPDVEGGKALNRWLPLVKWLLAIPHYFVGAFYSLISIMITVIAWFTLALTGNYPQWGIDFVMGTIKYLNRVYGYAFALVTDEYPPFKLG